MHFSCSVLIKSRKIWRSVFLRLRVFIVRINRDRLLFMTLNQGQEFQLPVLKYRDQNPRHTASAV
mgnify:CR=1 FL=1